MSLSRMLVAARLDAYGPDAAGGYWLRDLMSGEGYYLASRAELEQVVAEVYRSME